MEDQDLDIDSVSEKKSQQEKKQSKIIFQSPSGMHDILPDDFLIFEKLRSIMFEEAYSFGFLPIETTILEQTALFEKGVGQGTDIVEKEMYSLTTKGGDKLTLRPEATAGIMRAYFEHGFVNLPQPVKLFLMGSMFRHEKSQAGRYRSFHQFNLEILNSASPASDFEILQLVYNIFYKRLGLKDIIFEVSSVGDKNCRPDYEKNLKSFLKNKKSQLCQNCKKRISKNPMRVFDCKEEKCARVASLAPKIIDYLCKACFKHFKNFLEFLDDCQIPYNLNPTLVRGLDYYTKTVFEVKIAENTKNFENLPKLSICGGGRYDELGNIIGNKRIPSVGCAVGIERLIDVLKNRNFQASKFYKPKVFFAQLGFLAKKKSFKLFQEFLRNKIPSAIAIDKDSLKSQLKLADKLKVSYTIILGQKEVLEGTVIVRDMTFGYQEIISEKKIIDYIKNKLKKAKNSL